MMCCAWCKTPLEARRSHARTCTPRCRKALHRHLRQPRSHRLAQDLGLRPRDLWRTPLELFTQLDRVFHFELDAAALPDDTLCPRWITPQQDALTSSWGPSSGAVWLNPPYGRSMGGLLSWVRRIVQEVAAWDLTVVLLVPAWDGPRWAQEAFTAAAEKLILSRRLAYRHPDTGHPMRNSNFPSCLYVFDKRPGPARVRYVDPDNIASELLGV